MQNETLTGAVSVMTSAVSRVTWRRGVCCLHLAFCILHYCAPVHAQQLLERVLARIGTTAVTLTDVRVALALGLVEVKPGEDRETAALQRAIDRQLLLTEVARFPPPEPSAAAVAEEVSAMKSHAGPELDRLRASMGLDEAKLQELARQTLRIRAYTAQRFGTTAQVTMDEVRKYYDDHPDQFTRQGARVPFEEAEPTARQLASAERLRRTIDQWTRDLRTRAEVVVVGGQ